ncbi:MAG: hemerythrin domain-containing protein [Acidobacteriia bacterium]|nr:hemerythrin domain-containing protein [Terriglobia bacterium]
MKRPHERREFLLDAGLLVAGTAILPAYVSTAQQVPAEKDPKKPPEDPAEDVSPPEDLMREHGVLNRVLLIYGEILQRLNNGRDFPVEVLTGAAGIIRNFIEDYHEKLEEDHLFPRFEKAGKLVDLVHVLRRQHQAGRRLTSSIQARASASTLSNAAERKALAADLNLFVRMYRPHEAREDTILFPAIRSIVSAQEFDVMGDQFEDKEHALFGKAGFEGVVERVAGLEKTLGIYELAQFTPKV